MPHEFVRPFHFWCQKVLPLVFDDSLSYYEVLAKMRDYLNTAIEEINSIGSEFDGVKTQLTQLKTYVDEYFAGLDVNQAISDKLDNMVESGEMDAVITPIFAAYANPIFVASVADMIATNFAYANYENNKIYTFNQSTGLYQTTGKEFGGVVSSVDEMKDNDKYYALDSDGMLYSYDFPESAFVTTGLTYGGYRYGVNAMRPISNVYVLTTDSRVYTWNGSEYVDTGITYGLSNEILLWRRHLTSTDSALSLPYNGWYDFTQNNMPTNLPTNMRNANGFLLRYSHDNTQYLIVYDSNGGVWHYNGNEWTANGLNGFVYCENCFTVNETSIQQCNNGTENKPDNLNGVLYTIKGVSDIAQVYVSANGMFYRATSDEWHRILNEQDLVHINNAVSDVYALGAIMSREYANLRGELLNHVAKLQTQIYDLSDWAHQMYDALTDLALINISSESADIETENGNLIYGYMLVAKTDSTFTRENVPADAKAVGDMQEEINSRVNELSSVLENHEERISANHSEIITTKTTLNNRINNANKTIYENDDKYAVRQGETNNRLEALEAYVEVIGDNLTSVTQFSLKDNLSRNLLTYDNNELTASDITIVTDGSLTSEILSANSYAVGSAIKNLQSNAKNAETKITANEEAISELQSVTTALNNISILTTGNNPISTVDGRDIIGIAFTQKTDATLTESGVPADAKAVGEAIASAITNLPNNATTTVIRQPLNKTFITSADYQAICSQNNEPLFGLTTIEDEAAPIKLANATVAMIGASFTQGVGGSNMNSGEVIYSGQYGTWRRNETGYCYANIIRDYFAAYLNSTLINNGMGGITISIMTKYEVMEAAIPTSLDTVIAITPTGNDINGTNFSYNSVLGGLISLQAYCRSNNIGLLQMCSGPWVTNSMPNRVKVEAYGLEASRELKLATTNYLSELFNYYYFRGEEYGTFVSDGHPDDAMYKIMANVILNALGLVHPVVG